MLLAKERQNRCDKQPNQEMGDDSCVHIEIRLPDESLQSNPERFRGRAASACFAFPVAAALRATFDAGISTSRMRFAPAFAASACQAVSGYSLTVRKRSAFAITETELKLIAAPAIIGLRRMPNSG